MNASTVGAILSRTTMWSILSIITEASGPSLLSALRWINAYSARR
jgi:hypothetical protein